MRILLAAFLVAALAHAETLALKDARIHTVSHGVIEKGTVIVRDGKIVAVGASVETPAGARVIDCAGKVLIPGLVDTHSHLGIYARPNVVANSDGNESTGPVQSLVRAIDSIHPADPGIRLARAGGVTTANIMPGSGNVMGGQTAYVKLRGRTVAQMLIDLQGGPGGMKMANGENPKRNYGRRKQAPATRMKVMALQREIFQKARAYMNGKKDRPRDIALEPVVEILERKRTVHFHTHRADDILSALRLADEFGFELVLHHGTESFLVADEIAKRGVPVSHTIVDSPGGKPEAINLRFDNPALTAKAGVKVVINTDDPITESRFFLRTAGLCVRGGLTPDHALRAITLDAAATMHLDKRIGSIEPGKDADLVLLSGEPFSVYTRVLKTWIEGQLWYDRDKELRFATGGYYVRNRIPEKKYPQAASPMSAPHPDGESPRDAKTFVLRAGALSTAAGPTIANGVVVVENGRIKAVGEWGKVDVPAGAPVFAAAWVTPGLIDAHASAGLAGAFNVPADQDLDEKSAQNQAALRALDGFNARERLVRYLLAHGVVLVNAVPGPANTIAGQAGLFKTWEDTTAEATVRFPTAMVFNLGETPKSEREKAPGTRMGIAAFLRKALAEARIPPEEPDLDRTALRAVVDGKLPAIFVAHREDDLLTALRIAREFKLKVILSQATEGYLVRDELTRIPVLVAPTMQRAGDLQRFNTCLENAAILADSGVPVAITSGYESYVPKTRVVLFEAAVAAANGLGFERALASVTIEPARILGVAAEYGSIEPGKQATLVCYDGDPFQYATHVTHVFAGGRLVHRR